MVKTRRLTTLFLLGTLLFLIGCTNKGDENETAAPVPAPDSCSLLTGAEIAEALGLTENLNGQGTVDEDGRVSSCDWVFSEGGGGTVSIVIWGTPAESGFGEEYYRSLFIRGQAGLTDGKDDDVVPVSGLGDEAYFGIGNAHTSFWWRKDTSYTIYLSIQDYPIAWERFNRFALMFDAVLSDQVVQ